MRVVLLWSTALRVRALSECRSWPKRSKYIVREISEQETAPFGSIRYVPCAYFPLLALGNCRLHWKLRVENNFRNSWSACCESHEHLFGTFRVVEFWAYFSVFHQLWGYTFSHSFEHRFPFFRSNIMNAFPFLRIPCVSILMHGTVTFLNVWCSHANSTDHLS